MRDARLRVFGGAFGELGWEDGFLNEAWVAREEIFRLLLHHEVCSVNIEYLSQPSLWNGCMFDLFHCIARSLYYNIRTK
jgi:hypothetical protein